MQIIADQGIVVPASKEQENHDFIEGADEFDRPKSAFDLTH